MSCVQAVLEVAAKEVSEEVIEGRERIQASGRSGSGRLEREVITPALLGLGKSLNSHQKIADLKITGPGGRQWLVKEVELKRVPSNGEESESRTVRDIDLVMQLGSSDGAQTREAHVPVNIKCTQGSGYDNTSGVRGLGSVLLGTTTSNVGAFFEAARNGLPDVGEMTDYFFFAFSKESEDVCAWVSSLLSITANDCEGAHFSPAQTFPHIQIKYSAAAEALSKAIANGELPSDLNEARRRLLDVLSRKMEEHYKARRRDLKELRRAIL